MSTDLTIIEKSQIASDNTTETCISPSGRDIFVDRTINCNVSSLAYSNKLFQRVNSKERVFKSVDFKYTIFDNCYIRKCTFIDCNFTGCKFIGSNFRGSSFKGCDFNYATFEKTIIDESLLDNSCPPFENLKLHFARSLRINFQSLGDADAANKAIKLELAATEIHLKKAWSSNESYYRNLYDGRITRIRMFLKWLNFVVMDYIWGNGESTWKLVRAALVIMLLMSIIHIFTIKDYSLVALSKAIGYVPQIFLGVEKPHNYAGSYLAFVTFLRLVLFGFFMSILIKRFSKR